MKERMSPRGGVLGRQRGRRRWPSCSLCGVFVRPTPTPLHDTHVTRPREQKRLQHFTGNESKPHTTQASIPRSSLAPSSQDDSLPTKAQVGLDYRGLEGLDHLVHLGIVEPES